MRGPRRFLLADSGHFIEERQVLLAGVAPHSGVIRQVDPGLAHLRHTPRRIVGRREADIKPVAVDLFAEDRNQLFHLGDEVIRIGRR